jgi:hypothetical protein
MGSSAQALPLSVLAAALSFESGSASVEWAGLGRAEIKPCFASIKTEPRIEHQRRKSSIGSKRAVGALPRRGVVVAARRRRASGGGRSDARRWRAVLVGGEQA